jgi:hypothetical protein
MIVLVVSPGGDIAEKKEFEYKSKTACEADLKRVVAPRADPWGLKYQAVCVNRGLAGLGKKKDDGVDYD